MKLNISNPKTGAQKLFDILEEKNYRIFYDKRISDIVEGDSIGDEFKGYKLKITGGNDKQGFPMQQGILTTSRVRRLLKAGDSCYRPRRKGERRRKSVRGCIVSQEIGVLALTIVQEGDSPIPGLTDVFVPQRRIPKRASKLIRYIESVRRAGGEDNLPPVTHETVLNFIPVRMIPSKKEDGKPRYKSIKVQRLATEKRYLSKQIHLLKKQQARIKSRKAAEEYQRLLVERRQALSSTD